MTTLNRIFKIEFERGRRNWKRAPFLNEPVETAILYPFDWNVSPTTQPGLHKSTIPGSLYHFLTLRRIPDKVEQSRTMSVKAEQKSNKNEQSRTVSGIVEQSRAKSKKVEKSPEVKQSRKQTSFDSRSQNRTSFDWKIQKRTSFDHFGRIMSQTPQPGEAKLCLLWIVFIDKLQKKVHVIFSFVLVFYQFL